MFRAHCSSRLEDEGIRIEPVADDGVADLATANHVRTIAIACSGTSTAAVGSVGNGERHTRVPHREAVYLPTFFQQSGEAVPLFTERQSIVESQCDTMTHIQIAVAIFDGGDKLRGRSEAVAPI